MTETMTGVLVFHSETGTEGGYYAFQDSKFMELPAPDRWRCTRCGRVWDKDRDAEPRGASFAYHDPARGPGYFGYDEPHPELEQYINDSGYTQASNKTSLLCYEQGHAEWEKLYPNGMWSYEGLHMLNDGDHLRIYREEDPTQVVWEGAVKLRRVDSYGPEGGTLGWRVHQKEDVGVGEETWFRWFLDELPAELTPVAKKD
jgi:hypothetical protein